MQNIVEKMGSTIQTASGLAVYMGTEVEDELGRWNDSWAISAGYYVIHEGSHHHVYSINREKSGVKPVFVDGKKGIAVSLCGKCGEEGKLYEKSR